MTRSQRLGGRTAGPLLEGKEQKHWLECACVILTRSGSVVGSLWPPPHQTLSLARALPLLQSVYLHCGSFIRRCARAHKLFIGGLPFSTSSDRLREVFAQAGGVESATVVMEQETGRSRGFGKGGGYRSSDGRGGRY